MKHNPQAPNQQNTLALDTDVLCILEDADLSLVLGGGKPTGSPIPGGGSAA